MSTPTTPSSFLVILFLVLVALVWWRVTIVVVIAFVIAVLALGLDEVIDRIEVRPSTATVTGPPAGPAPDGDGTP